MDEQTLSVGLEIPSQQMDLDRGIQMQGHGLAPATDTSTGRHQGALVAEDGENTHCARLAKGSAGLRFSIFLGVCAHLCVHVRMRVLGCACMCLGVHRVLGCACVCACVHICVDGPVCMCSKGWGGLWSYLCPWC